MRVITWAAGAMLLLSTGFQSRAASEIAVAIRYLQADGVSHSQLYLYREDGKLLRQLTHWKSAQVMAPVFAPDGKTIVFTRKTTGAGECWSIEPQGGYLHKLETIPAWYLAAEESAHFTDSDPASAGTKPNNVSDEENPGRHSTPDGKQELILKSFPVDEEDNGDAAGSGSGKYFQLRNPETDKTVELGKLDGFVGLNGLMHVAEKTGNVFFIDPPLRVAFFWLHLNSTDHETVFALDLTHERLVRLSRNWAKPVPLPGESAFLTFTETLYESIPGSKKTANCSYLERWDSMLKKIRYGGGSAAICYGASMYRPGMKPAIITIFQGR